MHTYKKETNRAKGNHEGKVGHRRGGDKRSRRRGEVKKSHTLVRGDMVTTMSTSSPGSSKPLFGVVEYLQIKAVSQRLSEAFNSELCCDPSPFSETYDPESNENDRSRQTRQHISRAPITDVYCESLPSYLSRAVVRILKATRPGA